MTKIRYQIVMEITEHKDESYDEIVNWLTKILGYATVDNIIERDWSFRAPSFIKKVKPPGLERLEELETK